GGIYWNSIDPHLGKIAFALFLVSLLFIWSRPNKIARDLRINGRLIEEALDDIKLRNFPGADPTTFQKWRRAALLRRTWSWLSGLASVVVCVGFARSFFPPIVALPLLMLTLSVTYALIARPYFLERKAATHSKKARK